MTNYTDNLRLTLQALGENASTWGDVVNNGFVERLEDAIAGFCSINLTGSGDYTLSVANGAYDQARNMILRLGGTPSGARNVLIPAASKMYIVECTISAATSITIKAAGGTGVSVPVGSKAIIYCDGLNTYKIGANLSDFGITATAGELNILDGATLSTSELNVLDGITATVAELNILDGVTATAAEINILDGATLSTAELNILDGVTATAAELNILDGCVLTVGELNLLDGLTVSAGAINNLVSAASVGGTLIKGRMVFYHDGGGSSPVSVVTKSGVFVTAVDLAGAGNTFRVFVSTQDSRFSYTPFFSAYWSSVGGTGPASFTITSSGVSCFTAEWSGTGQGAYIAVILV